MAKIGLCDKCHKYSVIGYMPCKKANLCPDCSAEILGVSPEVVKEELMRRLLEDENNNNEQLEEAS